MQLSARDSTAAIPDDIVMSTVFRHFWVIFAVVMLINIALWRRSARAYVAAGWYTDEEANRFFRNTALWVVGYALLAELVAVFAGWPNVFCAFTQPTSPAGITMIVVTAAVWALLLRWVWLGRGAEILARFAVAGRRGGALASKPYDVRIVRLVVTLLVAWSLIMLVAQTQVQLVPPGICPASPHP